MKYGLITYDANGNKTLDIADRITRVLGEFTIDTMSGTIINHYLLQGSPWFIVREIETNYSSYWGENKGLSITITDNKISWIYQGYGEETKYKVIYGVF